MKLISRTPHHIDPVDHIRLTLADICIRGNWDDISLIRFLNHTSFLMRQPVRFLIFRSDFDGFGFSIYRHSTDDPFHHTAFMHAIKTSLFDAFNRLDAGRCRSYAIRLFSTNIYLIVFVETKELGAPSSQRSVRYLPCNVDHDVFNFYQRCFEKFKPALGSLGINTHISRHVEDLYEHNEHLPAKGDNPAVIPFDDESLHRLVGNAYARMQSTLLESIEAIKDNVLARRNNFGVPNYLVSVKIFNRSDSRFGCYFFNSKVCLSGAQQFTIALQLSSIATRKSHIPYPLPDFEDWFWRAARTPFGRKEIFRLVAQAPSQGTRLFVDGPLISGTISVDTDVFSQGDIGWFEGSYLSKTSSPTKESQKEHRRFCALHHILQLMAPDPECRTLLTFPVRVSGSTWITITTVTNNGRGDTDFLVNEAEFQRRFLLYHSIIRRLEDRIRQRMRDTYLRFCAETFGTRLGRSLNRQKNDYMECWRARKTGFFAVGPENADFDASKENAFCLNDDEIQESLRRSIAICRVFPFSPVFFGPKEYLDELSDAITGELDDRSSIWYGMVKSNPFFDRLRMRQFISAEQASRVLEPVVRERTQRHLFG